MAIPRGGLPLWLVLSQRFKTIRKSFSKNSACIFVCMHMNKYTNMCLECVRATRLFLGQCACENVQTKS